MLRLAQQRRTFIAGTGASAGQVEGAAGGKALQAPPLRLRIRDLQCFFWSIISAANTVTIWCRCFSNLIVMIGNELCNTQIDCIVHDLYRARFRSPPFLDASIAIVICHVWAHGQNMTSDACGTRSWRQKRQGHS